MPLSDLYEEFHEFLLMKEMMLAQAMTQDTKDSESYGIAYSHVNHIRDEFKKRILSKHANVVK